MKAHIQNHFSKEICSKSAAAPLHSLRLVLIVMIMMIIFQLIVRKQDDACTVRPHTQLLSKLESDVCMHCRPLSQGLLLQTKAGNHSTELHRFFFVSWRCVLLTHCPSVKVPFSPL